MTVTTCRINVGTGNQALYLNMYAYNGNGNQCGYLLITAKGSNGASICTSVNSNWSVNTGMTSWGPEYQTDVKTDNYIKYPGTNYIYVQPNYQNWYGYITFGCNFSTNTTVTVTSIGTGIGQLTTTRPLH